MRYPWRGSAHRTPHPGDTAMDTGHRAARTARGPTTVHRDPPDPTGSPTDSRLHAATRAAHVHLDLCVALFRFYVKHMIVSHPRSWWSRSATSTRASHTQFTVMVRIMGDWVEWCASPRDRLLTPQCGSSDPRLRPRPLRARPWASSKPPAHAGSRRLR